MILNHIRKLICFSIGVNISIISSPVGTPVNGSNNTFDYPILTNVSLMCIVTTPDGSPITATSYSWTATNCYNHTGGVQSPCFYSGGLITGNITGYSLLAPDAGTVTCTATITGVDFTSDPLTLRIAGEDDAIFSIFSDFYVHYNFCFQYIVNRNFKMVIF